MPTQLILWSQGRTACHLLERMLSNQPNTKLLWHPMAAARPPQVGFMRQSENETGSSTGEDAQSQYVDAVNAGIVAWEEAWEECRRGDKMLFVHEHPQFAVSVDRAIEFAAREPNQDVNKTTGNFTIIPDELLLKPGTSVILTLRHPAWVIPAAYRVAGTVEGSNTRYNLKFVSTMHWQRQIYDYYDQNGIRAVIAEAEDYMTSPDFVRKLCREAGLDPEHALFTWPKATEEEKASMPPIVVALMKSLLNSTGMIPSKATPPPNLKDEGAKWREEFGEEEALFIKQLVESALPDYEYLRARKLTL